MPFSQSACFVPIDSDEALQRATLVRSDPSLIGVSRRNIATEDGQYLWEYVAPNGETIDEVEPIKRWNSLGLPPAWSDVWICPKQEATYKPLAEMSKEDYNIVITPIGQR